MLKCEQSKSRSVICGLAGAHALMVLYRLPPWRGPGAAPPDFVRLAGLLEPYTPACAPQGPSPHPSSSDGTNIHRPPDGAGGSSSSCGSGAPSSAAPPPPSPQTTAAIPSLKRLPYDDLIALLPADICHAVDATACLRRRNVPSSTTPAGAPPSPRCSTGRHPPLPFGHRAVLALAKGAHFDPSSAASPSPSPDALLLRPPPLPCSLTPCPATPTSTPCAPSGWPVSLRPSRRRSSSALTSTARRRVRPSS